MRIKNCFAVRHYNGQFEISRSVRFIHILVIYCFAFKYLHPQRSNIMNIISDFAKTLLYWRHSDYTDAHSLCAAGANCSRSPGLDALSFVRIPAVTSS